MLLQLLRSATRASHVALEQSLPDGWEKSRDGYKRFLLMHSGVLPPLEAFLVENNAYLTLPQARQRLRLAALRSDLHALGLTERYHVDVSLLNDVGAAIGVSYVLEGSRLGANYLLNRIRDADDQRPVSFLSHGLGLGYWRTYQAWLASLDVDEAVARRAAEIANLTFELYRSSCHDVWPQTESCCA